MSTHAERTLTSADGTNVFVKSAGDSSKPAIVFLHGLSSSTLAWDSQFADQDLLRDFHLVRYDLRGHGRSGKPLDPSAYESVRFAEDFKAVCDGLGLERPFLAGWSLGGAVVVDIVAAYGPSYLSGILYIGGGVLSLTAYHPQYATEHIGKLISLFLSTDPDDVSRAAESFVDSCTAPGNPLPYAEGAKWLGLFVSQPRTARVNSFTRTQPYGVWEREARGLPVLIVQGAQDLQCTHEIMIRLAKGVYDDVEVRIIEGCGHCPAVESPAETNRYIREWTEIVIARQHAI
ncbi:alpha/beta-hydrolase [Trametes polyzona]|nr:alpha/beta-hydrolase [Trametes polyzona]